MLSLIDFLAAKTDHAPGAALLEVPAALLTLAIERTSNAFSMDLLLVGRNDVGAPATRTEDDLVFGAFWYDECAGLVVLRE